VVVVKEVVKVMEVLVKGRLDIDSLTILAHDNKGTEVRHVID
jgi:hypothetical protein